MGWKDTLGTISPLYGAATGRGMMGKMLNPDEANRLAAEENARQIAAAEQANVEHQNAVKASVTGGMKKGGKVNSASKRADGCCMRGKTRGKIR